MRVPGALAGTFALALVAALGCSGMATKVVSVGMVTGTVQDNFGQPLGGISVRATTMGSSGSTHTTVTKPDGTYKVSAGKGLVSLSFSGSNVVAGSTSVTSPGLDVVEAPLVGLITKPVADGVWVGSDGRYTLVPWLPTKATERPAGGGGTVGCHVTSPGAQVSLGDKRFYIYFQGSDVKNYRLLVLPKNVLWSEGSCSDRGQTPKNLTTKQLPEGNGSVSWGDVGFGTYCVIRTEGGVYGAKNMDTAACFYWRGSAKDMSGDVAG